MSLHIKYDHRCPKCSAFYIPYDADVACPECGLLEQERFSDFIPQAARSAQYNFDGYGRFIPPAWIVQGFADHVLQLLFLILQDYMEDRRKWPFADFASERVEHIDWGAQTYAKGHLYGMALRVFEELGRPAPYPEPVEYPELQERAGPVEFKPNAAEMFQRLSMLYRLIPGSVRWRSEPAMIERALPMLLPFGFRKPFFKRAQDFVAESILASPSVYCALSLEIVLTEFSVRERPVYWDGGGQRTDLAERMESWSLMIDGIGHDHIGAGIMTIFAIPAVEDRFGDLLQSTGEIRKS